jgi:hypothetical protein
MWRILQNIFMYLYKMQVQIVVASMTIHNYIRRKLREDVAFAEFDYHEILSYIYIPFIYKYINYRKIRVNTSFYLNV